MQTYLVGGAVRDKLLNHPFHEKDWVVVGSTPEAMIDKGYKPVGKDFPVFLHPETGEEYALARTERKIEEGHTGFECYTSINVTLEEDLLRRDLTINAIAEDRDGNLIDPYNGQQDLEKRILRHVSPAFAEDPLRVLRVARFYARYAHLGFKVAKETIQLMCDIVATDEIETLPAERIFKELESALKERSPQLFFILLQDTGATKRLFPNLSQLSSETLAALSRAGENNAKSLICFSLLFADISEQSTNQLCKTIKAPKQFHELASLVSSYTKQYLQLSLSADDYLSFFENTDAFRRSVRFHDLLACCHYLFGPSEHEETLKSALSAASTIDAKPLVEKGLKGTAIAQALRHERSNVISELINRL